MKGSAITFGAILALSACSRVSEEDQLEHVIRARLSADGNVQQVELTKQGANDLIGFAVVRDANGSDKRLNCTAHRREAAHGEFEWRCVPAAGTPGGQAVLERLKALIRQSYSAEATVLQIEMNWQDDDHVVGFVLLRDREGNEGRHNCTAARDPANPANMPWRCEPAQGAQPPAEQEGAPAENADASGQ